MIPFIITLLAGLSTLIGSLVIFIKKDKDKIISSSLAFTAGIMISISFFDLLKETINMFNIYSKNKIFLIIFIFSTAGIIITSLIKIFIEHFENSNLYKIGIVSMLALIIHNIPEGMATFIASNQSIKLGINLAIAIAFHNIPEGISIAVPIYYASNSYLKAFLYTFLSGFSEFIGALITSIFLKSYINNILLGCIFSFIIGIMIYIPIFELIPTALKYDHRNRVVVYMIIGLVVVIINTLLF